MQLFCVLISCTDVVSVTIFAITDWWFGSWGKSRWKNFILLLQIEEIVFAPKTTVQLAAYLDVLVGDYLEDFKELCERPIIPKQHYMVHYPRQIVRLF